MRPFLKWLHIVGVIGFLGGMAIALTLSLAAQETTADGDAVIRRAIALASGAVALPSLLLLLLSGMFSVVVHKPFLAARWVWAKVAIGVLVAGVVLLVVQPAIDRVARLAGGATIGLPMFGVVDSSIRQERLWGGLVLVAGLGAAALGVWRPRLGRRDDE